MIDQPNNKLQYNQLVSYLGATLAIIATYYGDKFYSCYLYIWTVKSNQFATAN